MAATRLRLQTLEDRLTPSWAPAQIGVPVAPLTVTLDAQGDASGTGTNVQGENDFVRFTAPRAGTYTFSAGAQNSWMDTVLGVFNSSGARLGYNDDVSRRDTDSRVSLTLAAGQTYYLGITRYTGEAGGGYSWAIDGPAASPAPTPTPAPTAGFQIEVRFGAGLTASQQAIFRQAAARWQRVIVGDLPNATYRGRAVDDVLIDASGSSIDGLNGVLGQAGPDAFRSGSRLPIHGSMEFDSADLASLERRGDLLNVITHEMGHVLGFGTLWEARGLLAGAGTSNPRLTGANATAEYNRLFGRAERGVPVENGGGSGTRDSHWRETSFGAELMTGYVNYGVANPLSRVTVASMADLGYQVNMAAAEAYAPPASVRAAASAASVPSWMRGLVADAAPTPAVNGVVLIAPPAWQPDVPPHPRHDATPVLPIEWLPRVPGRGRVPWSAD